MQIENLYIPEYKGDYSKLVKSIQVLSREIPLEQLQNRSITAAIINGTKSPRALSIEEYNSTVAKIEALKKNIQSTRNRLNTFRDNMNRILENDPQLAFTLNIEYNSFLKKSVRKVFGKKTNTITYAMYKEAIKRRAQLQEEDVKQYFNRK